jgi:hypothetical protein
METKMRDRRFPAAGLILLFAVLNCLGSQAGAEEEIPLSAKLKMLRNDLNDPRGTLLFSQVASVTEPMLERYKNDAGALKEIYLLRMDFAWRRRGTPEDRFAETEAALNHLLPGDTNLLPGFQSRLTSAAAGLNKEKLDEIYAGQRKSFEGTEDAGRFLQGIAMEACRGYAKLGSLEETFAAYDYLLSQLNQADPNAIGNPTNLLREFFRDRARLKIREEKLLSMAEALFPYMNEKTSVGVKRPLFQQMLALYGELGKNGEILKVTGQMLEIDPDYQEWNFAKAEALIALDKLPEATTELKALILKNPLGNSARALRLLMNAGMDQGDSETAVGCARTLFDIAGSEQEVSEAVRGIARCLAIRDGNLTNANNYILFQKWGAAGPDGVEKTADDLAPVEEIFTGFFAKDEEYKAKLQEQIAENEKSLDLLDTDALRTNACLYLLKGEPDKALPLLRQAYVSAVADVRKVDAIGWELASALRASSGFLFAARDFLDFQELGTAGVDGETGTQDDLKDMFGNVPTLDEKIVAAAREEFKEALYWNPVSQDTQNAGVRYASALTRCGKHQQALSVALSLYEGAWDERSLNNMAAAVASILRARDHQVLAANAFLKFQRYGPAGEDGIAGSNDDLANPLAETPRDFPSSPVGVWLGERVPVLTAGRKYREAAYALIYLGQPRQALPLLMKARALCSFDNRAITQMTLDFVAALRALSGHNGGADAFLKFQQYGLAGEDGKTGNDDDLKDPLAELLNDGKVAKAGE